MFLVVCITPLIMDSNNLLYETSLEKYPLGLTPVEIIGGLQGPKPRYETRGAASKSF